MPYSLLSRFRGALLGAVLGDLWGLSVQSCLERGDSLPESAANLRDPGVLEGLVPAPAWGRLLMMVGQKAVLQPYAAWSETSFQKILGSTVRSPTDVAMGIAIATLPLALLRYEGGSEEDLRSPLQVSFEALQKVLTGWQLPLPMGRFAEVSSHFLSDSLQAQPRPARLLDGLLRTPSIEDEPVLQEALKLVQHALLRGSSLSVVLRDCQALAATGIGSPSPLPLALAIYCFLSTPEDFELTLLRASRLGQRPRLICSLAGAFSGCHNATSGLPVAWLNSLRAASIQDKFLKPFWDIASGDDVIRLAGQLLTTWSGAYPNLSALEGLAIAAPEVMRPY